MTDTPRTEAELLTIFADGQTGTITAQDMRDFVVSIPPPGGLSADIVSTDAYPDAPATVLHTAEALTDDQGTWTAVGGQSGALIALDTTIFSTGTASVSCDLAYPSGSGTSQKLYVNLATPLPVGGHPRVSVDIRWTSNFASQHGFDVVAASGPGLTGTIVRTQITDANAALSATWYTIEVQLTGLTQIASVGVVKRGTNGASSKHAKFWLDNVIAMPATGLDSALIAEPTAAIVIPPTYTSAFPQSAQTLTSFQSILDLRPTHANVTGMRGVKDVRDWNIDENGTMDVTSELVDILASLSPGDILSFPPDGIFWIENGLNLSANIGITLECHGARFVEHAHRDGSIVNLSGSFNTIRDMHVIGLGTPSTLSNGSALINVSGTGITNVGTTKSLATAGDTVRIQGQGSAIDAIAQTYSRDIDGYIQFDLVMSQAAPITNDCHVVVTDSYNRPSSFPQNVSFDQTFTLTPTPTTYTIRFQPIDLFPGHKLTITKVATGSPIIVTSYTPYHQMQNLVYQSDNGSNHGLAISGHHNTADNVFCEGMGGDEIIITSPLDNTINMQPNWPQGNRVRNFFGRACGRHGITVNHCTDVVLEDFVIYNCGRDGMDIEPEGDSSHVSHMTFKDGILSGGENGGLMISSAAARQDHITFDNVWFKGNGGSPLRFDFGVGSIIRDCTVTSEDGTGIAAEFQGGTLARPAGTSGSLEGLGMTVEHFKTQNVVRVKGDNIKLRDIHCERLIQDGTLVVTALGCDIDGVMIGGPTMPYTIDPALKFTPVMLMDDTTYRNISCPAWQTEFGNTYRQDVVQGNAWYPRGLEMLGSGVRSIRALSGTNTPANNLRGLGVAVTASATTKTIAFPAKTDVLNIAGFNLTASGPERTHVFCDAGNGAANGTWTLTYNGQTTPPFTEHWQNGDTDVTTSAATVQAALQALSTIGAGNVTVTGTNVFNAGFQLNWGVAFTTTVDHTALLSSVSTIENLKDQDRRVEIEKSSTGGSVTPGTYYYRVAGRTTEGGPLAGLAEKSVVVASTQNQVTVALTGVAYNQTSDLVVQGWTVWRGTVAGGPYTRRYDVISATGFGLDTSLIDHETDFGGDISPQTGSWAAAEVSSDQTGFEPDVNYGVFIVPSWATTVAVTAKRTNGFDMTFGTAAPSGATVDWFLVR